MIPVSRSLVPLSPARRAAMQAMPPYGHVFTHSTPGAGISAHFHTLIKAALKTERAGGQHD